MPGDIFPGLSFGTPLHNPHRPPVIGMVGSNQGGQCKAYSVGSLSATLPVHCDVYRQGRQNGLSRCVNLFAQEKGEEM